jgi:hypothetical protein
MFLMHFHALGDTSPQIVRDSIIISCATHHGRQRRTPPPRNRHGGRVPGRANYQNNILIPIIERILSNGAEAWRLVAIAYKAESGEHELRTEEDLHNNWVRKLCNNFKKPTGSTGDISDRIHRCIEIERRIQCESNSGILGASPAKDSEDPDNIEDKASGEPSNHQTDSQDGA